MSPLKKYIVIGLSCGAAFAFVVLAAVGTLLWYQSRPKPPGPWNTSAVRATFYSAHLEGTGKDRNPLFFYKLDNTTDYDYEIGNKEQVQYFFRDSDSLSDLLPGGLALDLPLFIPAKRSVTVGLHLKFFESGAPLTDGRDETNSFIRDKKRLWNEYNGFVVLDKSRRYQIDLPKGW